MTRAKRWLLWGAVLAPVAILPSAFIVSRIWLHQQLQRELGVGDLRIRLSNPVLGWNLTFSTDSLEVESPALTVRAGRMLADLRLWNSLASLKPSLRVEVGDAKVRLAPDSSGDSARAARKRSREALTFPNLRIPVEFHASISRLEIARGPTTVGHIGGIEFRSDGPKGVVLEASGADLPGSGGLDSLFALGASFRASARWFGKTLRYQVRGETPSGDFLRLEGERPKTDLRLGRDSLDLQAASLSAYSRFIPGNGPREFSGISLNGAVVNGENKAMRVRVRFTAPPVWLIGPQRVEGTLAVEDSSGRLVLAARGSDGESFYLQGHFQSQLLGGLGWSRISSGLSASLSGYSRGFRFPIGGKVLPGDAEIRRLKILPGLKLETELRTRDNSVILANAFRVPDPSGPGAIDSSWKCEFTGTISPVETWAHAWVDTNVDYSHARVKGDLGSGGLTVEAWIRDPRAYGAAGDSLYAQQRVTRTGFYLTDSRLHAKGTVWPVTGQVEWKKGDKSLRSRTDRRRVSLSFRTRHPHHGFLEYAMPLKKSMSVRAENLDVRRLPYTRLETISARLPADWNPLLTGRFDWDWLSRTGSMDLHSTLAYQGENLALSAEAAWDASLFEAKGLDFSVAGSSLRLSGGLRLGGLQFWQMRKLGIKDIRNLALEAHRFDATRLSSLLGKGYPVERGYLHGKLAYVDSTGFSGLYEADSLDLRPIRKLAAIHRLTLTGRGESLILGMRTASTVHPWLNDTVSLELARVLGPDPAVGLQIVSDEGLTVSFRGGIPGFRSLDGSFAVAGNASLPGQGGEIRDIRIEGRLAAPFSKDILKRMVLDSGAFRGKYAIPSLDTQAFSGTMSIKDGRMRIPDLRSMNGVGISLTGEAEYLLEGPPSLTARISGRNLTLQWPGIQKLVLTDAEASLRMDASGLTADASLGKVEVAMSRPPVNVRGNLENVAFSYSRPATGVQAAASAGEESAPKLKVKAQLRDFLFRHKIGFREMQRSIRAVKTDKRRKRVKPMDLEIDLVAAGAGNRIETDILRMAFLGDVSVKGIYPYTLITGEFSALNGELGQIGQSYDITDFGLKWRNATIEAGRITVEGSKRLRSDCKPDTERTCNVYVKLAGRLDEMAFTYDSDCGGNTGETIEPTALINSVSRGCYSDEYVAGAGGGNYGEAVFTMLEPAINERLSRVGSRFSGGWLKSTQVTGIGTMVSGDTVSAEPIAIGVESKEKWGMSVKARAGYHPEKKQPTTWENRVSLEWRPPLEKVSSDAGWKRRVRDRVTLEASAENRPEEKLNEQNREVRKQVGIRYRYKFWNLW